MIIDSENIITYWEESERIKKLAIKCGLFQKTADGLGVATAVQP